MLLYDNAFSPFARMVRLVLDHKAVPFFWRGDRIEWLLARGFHAWFVGEIEADRVL